MLGPADANPQGNWGPSPDFTVVYSSKHQTSDSVYQPGCLMVFSSDSCYKLSKTHQKSSKIIKNRSAHLPQKGPSKQSAPLHPGPWTSSRTPGVGCTGAGWSHPARSGADPCGSDPTAWQAPFDVPWSYHFLPKYIKIKICQSSIE